MSLAQRERQALVALLAQVGADAPTLCEGWTTGDLAAHLFVRENRPRALISGFESEMARVRAELSYPELLARIAAGPPALLQRADAAMNTIEFFVHHEDVRRPRGDGPRALSQADRDELARRLGPMTLAAGADLPTYVTATDTAVTYKLRGGRGEIARHVRGPISEIVLFTLGRSAVVDEELRPLP